MRNVRLRTDARGQRGVRCSLRGRGLYAERPMRATATGVAVAPHSGGSPVPGPQEPQAEESHFNFICRTDDPAGFSELLPLVRNLPRAEDQFLRASRVQLRASVDLATICKYYQHARILLLCLVQTRLEVHLGKTNRGLEEIR